MKIRIGTSGFNYKEWKGSFYPDNLPQKKWLEFYASKFDSVEINNSFYITVKPATYENWYKITPAHFIFVIKGHRFITQLKKLAGVEDSVRLFFENAKPLGEKLKVVLWQFPRNFSFNEKSFERLKTFLDLVPQNIKHAFEFREKGWFRDEVCQLLEANNSTLVIAQSSKFPEIEMPGGKLVYIRLHGPKGLYSSGYTDNQLENWAKKIRLYSKKEEVYAFFNNDNGGYATENAMRLKSLM